jgi:lysophospholipase L1-like esterase
VAEDDSIWARRLERGLRADGIQVEILNGGAAGLLTDSWVSLLERVKDSFQPDLILAVFFLRDGTQLGLARHFFQPIRQQVAERNQRSRLYRHVYLVRWMRDAQDRKRISEVYERALVRAYLGDSSETEEWRMAQANLRRIQSIGNDIGARVGLVVFPALIELDSPQYPFHEVEESIARFGRSLGLPTLDLLPTFRGRNATTLWVSALDQHPNASGHALAAGALRPFVKSLLAQSGGRQRVDSR